MARVRQNPPEAGTAPVAALPAPRPRGAGANRTRKPAASVPAARGPQMAQVMLIAGIVTCAFVVVALASWSSHDPSLSVAGSGPVHNLGGPIGAWVADACYQTVGWPAWLVVFVGARMALRLAGRPGVGWLATGLGVVGAWMLSTGVQLAFGAGEHAFPPGGVVGLLTAQLLTGWLGAIGAAMVVTLALVASATLLFRIDWQPLAARAVDRVGVATPIAARAVGAAGVGVVKVGVKASSTVASALKERWTARQEAAAAEAEAEAEEEEGDEDPSDEIARPDRSVWSARPAPPVRMLPAPVQADPPTAVGGRALVEVEYEPTTSATTAPLRPAPRRAVAPPISAVEDDLDLGPGVPEVGDRVIDAAPPRRDNSPLRRPVALDDDYDVPAVARPRVEDPPTAAPLAPVAPPPVAVVAAPAPVVSAPVAEPYAAVAPPVETPRRPLPSFGDDVAPFRSIVPEDPAPRRPAPRKGRIEIAPGNLQSGGATDDGSAVRDTNAPFQLPPLGLLDDHPAIVAGTDEGRLHDLARKLTAKLQDFGVEGRVSSIRPGPVITMFEYEPAPGIKLSKIAALADDIAMALKALGIRIVAPIPGRGVVGVEVPNEVRHTVWARDVFAAPEFRDGRHYLPVVLGKDTEGRPYVADLARMPHLLVGGTTGSGKSVGINAMLISMMLTRTPDELRLILIDPKMLEFELYKDIPHLLHPVVTEAKLASRVLAWACEEMDHRYRTLGDWKVRNIESFNQKVEHESVDWTPEKARSFYPDWPEGQLIPIPKKLPYIVVVIDELADLMMVASKDVEMSIARLAQKARASGIHLIVATQRPSADVITGLIRSNMPSRLAYQVRTKTESRIILDQNGADALLGKGDLLFLPAGVGGLTRIHGPFLSDEEVRRVADFLREQAPPQYAPSIRLDEDGDGEEDELEQLDEEMGKFYNEVIDLAIEKGAISTSMIQRHLKIGYNRACLLMEQLEKQGVVGPADGAKPRKVLIRD